MWWYSWEVFLSNFVLFTCICMHNLWKTKGSNSPWDLYWGKQNIQAKKVYSSTSRGVGATSSPGRFSLALEVGREKRPGGRGWSGRSLRKLTYFRLSATDGKTSAPSSYILSIVFVTNFFSFSFFWDTNSEKFDHGVNRRFLIKIDVIFFSPFSTWGARSVSL